MRPRTVTAAPFDEILRKGKSEDLFNLAEAMARLQDDSDFERLGELIDEGVDNAKFRLVHGPLKEQAEYARVVGMISGLEMLREIPQLVRDRAKQLEQALAERDELAQERR